MLAIKEILFRPEGGYPSEINLRGLPFMTSALRGEGVPSKADIHAVYFISNTLISNIVRFGGKLRYRD